MMINSRKSVPHRPAISDVLIKASASRGFRQKLLATPNDAIAGMDLSPDDAAILSGVQAGSLKDYACQIKSKLLD